MRIPSVALGLHERYTPEVGDRILEKLQAPAEPTAYHLLTPMHLRSLAATKRGPILSF
jgi:hypothetical protein